MLHVLHQRQWDIASSPFARELERQGIEHRFLISPISLRYKSPLKLFLRIYPKLAWNTLRLGIHSLVLARPPPAAILVSTDIEALLVGLLRLVFRRKTLIVLQTLIVTPRRSYWFNWLYMAYWRLITGLIDLGICHSTAEVHAYAGHFPRARCRFVYVPFGLTVACPPEQARSPEGGPPVIVSAGRSGRDYLTLAQAVEGLPCRLRIVCDIAQPLEGVRLTDQIEVVDDCFDGAYLAMLASAALVVVPLAIGDVSAGQMVFLQAAALGRPVIMTRTATTTDYASDGEDSLLVERGDVASLRHAIERLLNDRILAGRLGSAAQARFNNQHTTEAYVRQVVAAIGNEALRRGTLTV